MPKVLKKWVLILWFWPVPAVMAQSIYLINPTGCGGGPWALEDNGSCAGRFFSAVGSTAVNVWTGGNCGANSGTISIKNNSLSVTVWSGTWAQAFAQFGSAATALNVCTGTSIGGTVYGYTNYWKNVDSIGHNVQVTSNGVFVFQEYLKPGDSVAVGGFATNNFQNWGINVLNSDNGLMFNNPTVYTTNAAWGTPGSSQYPILGQVYGGGTNIVPGATVGDNAIFDAITKLAQQQHFDMIYSNTVVFNAATNRDGLTTNMSSGGIPSFATNATAATSAATTQLGSTPGDMDTIGNGMGTGPSLGSGSSTLLTVDMMGYTLHLDPEYTFPGFMGWIKTLNTFLLIVAFARFAGNMLWEATQTYAQSETGGVPDLEGSVSILGCSVSANVVGLIVALVVPVAFIVLWKVVLDYFLGGAIATFLGQVSTSVNGFGMNGNAAALYLLDSMFPITLFFSLLTTSLGLYFLASKLVVVAASASRFLFGK